MFGINKELTVGSNQFAKVVQSTSQGWLVQGDRFTCKVIDPKVQEIFKTHGKCLHFGFNSEEMFKHHLNVIIEITDAEETGYFGKIRSLVDEQLTKPGNAIYAKALYQLSQGFGVEASEEQEPSDEEYEVVREESGEISPWKQGEGSLSDLLPPSTPYRDKLVVTAS